MNAYSSERRSDSEDSAARTGADACVDPARDRSLLRQAQRVLAHAGTSPASPCLAVCQMSSHTGLCAGCWRSLDEIARWGSATVEFKREVWRRIRERLESAYPPGASV